MLTKSGLGFGAIALQQILASRFVGGGFQRSPSGVLPGLHHAPKAKRVIFLFQSGGPSQMDLFDHKPLLNELHGTELPAEVRRGQRLTG